MSIFTTTATANQYQHLNDNLFNSYGIHMFNDGQVLTRNGIEANRAQIGSWTEQKFYSRLNISGLWLAHFQGWNGQGVNIGVAEPEPTLREVHNGTANQRHRWMVSGIVYNTAPGATVSQFDHNGRGTTSRADIDIFNHSYTNNPTLRQAADANAFSIRQWNGDAPNALHVRAAGNNGDVNEYSSIVNADASNVIANRISFDTTMNIEASSINNWIFAGAVDRNNNLASYSVSAGNTYKDHFIVTEGTDVYGKYICTQSIFGQCIDRELRFGEGTSFAAPRVAGAAALVMQKFGTNAVNTKNILLNTADDLGAPGVDNVFGHGKLNVHRALSPIGHIN